MSGTDHPRIPMAYRMVAVLLRPLMLILTKRDWRGAENLPREGGFVVSPNHVSYFDPLAFAHFMYDGGRPAFFLGKKELFDVPIVGWALRKCGQIPVYRNSTEAGSAYQAAVDGVRAGKAVGIYPEGTITRDPDLWPMRGKTGAARVALETQCPLIPVAQWGAQRVLVPYGHRPKLFPRSTMTMVAGPPVDLDDLHGQPIDSRTLRLATDRLMEAITGLLEQARGERAPAERFDPRHHGVSETGNPTNDRDPGQTQADTNSTDGDMT